MKNKRRPDPWRELVRNPSPRMIGRTETKVSRVVRFAIGGWAAMYRTTNKDGSIIQRKILLGVYRTRKEARQALWLLGPLAPLKFRDVVRCEVAYDRTYKAPSLARKG
jgi:hypothetical protein